MLLVPRQLQRSGMTGAVPYYGGRLTPAQAWAASHPSASNLPPGVPSNEAVLGRVPVPQAPTQNPALPAPTRNPTDSLAALQQLLSAGVISQPEYQQLAARVQR